MINLARMSVIAVVETNNPDRVKVVVSDGGSVREPIAELSPDEALDLMDQLADNGLGAADVGQRGDLLVRAPAWRI